MSLCFYIVLHAGKTKQNRGGSAQFVIDNLHLSVEVYSMFVFWMINWHMFCVTCFGGHTFRYNRSNMLPFTLRSGSVQSCRKRKTRSGQGEGVNPQDLERTWCVESQIHLGLLPMEERGWEVQTWELTWKSTHCFVLTRSKQAFFLIFSVVCSLVLHSFVSSCFSLSYCAPSLPFYRYPYNTSLS